jgi:tetratricopeptide (TPR) repeat protein
VQEAAARLYNREAARAEAEGDVELALRMHRLALELHPDFLDVDTPAPGDDRAEQRMERLRDLLRPVRADHPNAGLALLLRGAVEYGLLRLRRHEPAQTPARGKRAAAGKEARSVRATLNAAVEAGVMPELGHKLLAELAFYELMDDKAALEHVNRALQTRPDFVGALWVKAVILSEGMGSTAEAAACYRRILEITPNNPTILLCLGDLYFDHGQPHRALGCYRRVLEERPGDIGVNRDIGHCYLVLQRYGDAISTFARMDADGTTGLDIQLDLAEAQLCVGERVEAGNLIERVLAANEGLDPAVEARALELSAALALARRNPRQALKELKKAHETQLSTFGLVQRVRANIELGRLDDAQDDAEEVIQLLEPLLPEALDARYHLARVQFLRQDLDAALKTLGELLELSPLDERAFRTMAWIQRLQGKLEEADETDARRRFAAEVGRVHRLMQYEDYSDALAAARKLAEDFPARVEPRFYLACALAQTGEEEQALALVLRIWNESPELRRRVLEEYWLEPLRLWDRPEFRLPDGEPLPPPPRSRHPRA